MASLPPNSTSRLFLDYTTGRVEHTLVCRYAPGRTPSDALIRVRAFLDTLPAVLPETWVPVRARYQPAGTNFTTPIELGAMEGFEGENPFGLSPVDEPREFRWVGRSYAFGKRASVSLYGVTLATPSDYRYELPGSAPSLEAARQALIDAGPGYFVAIDDNAPAWYPYVNVNYNSYWERRARVS